MERNLARAVPDARRKQRSKNTPLNDRQAEMERSWRRFEDSLKKRESVDLNRANVVDTGQTSYRNAVEHRGH